jgi:hypothetical protein
MEVTSMWLKFYDRDGKLDFAVNSDKISSMFAIKDFATLANTTKIYLINENDIHVSKSIEEIMKMIEKGDEKFK